METRMLPNVSIIMNCLNGEEYLRDAIDSVYAQTYPDWEIIFWDNASTDNSGAIATSYDDKLVYFRGDKTVPLGYARNLAIEKARGQLIAFLDCDDMWLPGKLDAQISYFKDPDIGLVYSDFYYLNNQSGKRRRAFGKKICPSGNVFREFLTDYRLNMQTVIIRNLPGNRFNPHLTISEEYDLFMRILIRHKAKYVSEALAIYRLHSLMYSRSHIDLYPQEMGIILQQFEDDLDGFSTDYAEEKRYLLFKLEYWKARAAMASGDQGKALRYLIRSEGFWTKKIPLIALAMFGKYAWRFVHSLSNRYY